MQIRSIKVYLFITAKDWKLMCPSIGSCLTNRIHPHEGMLWNWGGELCVDRRKEGENKLSGESKMRNSMNNRHLRKMCQKEYESLHLLKHAKNKLRCDIQNHHEQWSWSGGPEKRQRWEEVFSLYSFFKKQLKHRYTHTSTPTHTHTDQEWSFFPHLLKINKLFKSGRGWNKAHENVNEG